MTRGRLLLSFVLFIALCASVAYWVLQLYDPPLRPVAAPSQQQFAAPRLEAAAAVFGGQPAAPTATNFQLRGVIVSGTPLNSVAIIAVEGKPPQAFRANAEVTPGVTVQEVHRDHVLLSDGGTLKRVELPAAREGREGIGMSARAPVSTSPATPSGMSPPMAAPSQATQSAPAQRTTVVTQGQQDQGGASAEAASDTSAPSAEVTESGDDPEQAQQPDPSQMQANPPRR